MYSTFGPLHQAIVSHERKCLADMDGLTSLASEQLREVMCKGPKVDALITIVNIERLQKTPGGNVSGWLASYRTTKTGSATSLERLPLPCAP